MDRLQKIKDMLAARKAQRAVLPTALTDENVVATAMRYVGSSNDDDMAWLVAEIERRDAVLAADRDQEAGVGNLTPAELLAALKVEREHRLDGAVLMHESLEAILKAEQAEKEKLVASFRTSNEAYNQMAAKYDALLTFARRLWHGERQRARLSEHRALVLEAHRLGVIALPAGVADALKAVEPLEARP